MCGSLQWWAGYQLVGPTAGGPPKRMHRGKRRQHAVEITAPGGFLGMNRLMRLRDILEEQMIGPGLGVVGSVETDGRRGKRHLRSDGATKGYLVLTCVLMQCPILRFQIQARRSRARGIRGIPNINSVALMKAWPFGSVCLAALRRDSSDSALFEMPTLPK